MEQRRVLLQRSGGGQRPSHLHQKTLQAQAHLQLGITNFRTKSTQQQSTDNRRSAKQTHWQKILGTTLLFINNLNKYNLDISYSACSEANRTTKMQQQQPQRRWWWCLVAGFPAPSPVQSSLHAPATATAPCGYNGHHDQHLLLLSGFRVRRSWGTTATATATATPQQQQQQQPAGLDKLIVFSPLLVACSLCSWLPPGPPVEWKASSPTGLKCSYGYGFKSGLMSTPWRHFWSAAWLFENFAHSQLFLGIELAAESPWRDGLEKRKSGRSLGSKSHNNIRFVGRKTDSLGFWLLVFEIERPHAEKKEVTEVWRKGKGVKWLNLSPMQFKKCIKQNE